MKKFRALMKQNWWKLLRMEIIFTIIRGMIFLPLCNVLFKLSLSAAGLQHVTPDTLGKLVSNPVTILSGLIALALTVLLTLTEISSILVCLHGRAENGKADIFDMIAEGARRSRALFKWKNWFLIPFMLIMLPFTGLFSMTGVITTLKLPEFTLDAILHEPRYYIPAGIVFVILSIIVLLCSLVFHGMLLKGESFFESAKKSAKILKWRLVRFVLRITVATLLAALPLLLLTGLIDLIGFGVIALVVAKANRYTAAMILCIVMGGIHGFLTARLAMPITYTIFSCEYERIEAIKGEDCDLSFSYTVQPKRRRRLFYAAIAVTVIIAVASYGLNLDDVDFLGYTVPEITAHRGSSVNKPENSVPAFEQAIEDNADWIELDVHQTKDGVIVVTHDDNLRRIAGKNVKIRDLTYAELMEYDVGSWFSPEFKDLHVATLDEVLKLCKGKVKVNIELKPTGREVDFEEGVIAVVRENGFEDDCVLASLNVASVKRCKELAPDIHTLLLLQYARGDMSAYTYADGFSIEASSVSADLVRNVHSNGKTIIAWTVNRTENVKPLIEVGVDGIITDDPVLIREAAIEAISLTDYSDIVELFFPPTIESEALQNMDGCA